MPFKKGETPPGAKPFQKGQSGNPSGKSRVTVTLEERRKANSIAILDGLSDADRDDAILRWWQRFRAGSKDALWLVPYAFGQPPKAAEPEQNADDKVTGLDIRRLDTTDAGTDTDAAAPV